MTTPPTNAKSRFQVGAKSEAIAQELSSCLKAGEDDAYILDLRGRYFRGRYVVTAVRAKKIDNIPPPRGNR